jgi:hypothetical protein
MIASWIFLTLSVSHFALAAPVAAGEIAKVCSNPVQVLNDGIATWEKRMGPNDKDQSSTNDVQLPHGGTPGGVQDAEGFKEKGMSRWGWEWELPYDAEELGSGRGPAANPVRISNNWNWKISYNPTKEVSDGGNGNGKDGSGGDVGVGDHAVQSSQGSAENMSPGPQSEHPATPDLMTSLKEWFKQPGKPLKVFRPRNSGSGAVGTPNRELQGTVAVRLTLLSFKQPKSQMF